MTTQSEAEHAVGMFLDQIRGKTSVDQMFEQISDLAQIFNCGWVAYGAPTHARNMERKSRIKLPQLITYPEAWQEHCVECGYDMLEPSVKQGPFQLSPLLWADVHKDPNTTNRERRIFDEAKEFGLRIGVTIPLPWLWDISPTMSFVQAGTTGLSDFAITRLQTAALAFHVKVLECLDLGADVPSLTARQKECISWVAKGKSSWVIGAILGISSNTVDYHIKIVMKKIGNWEQNGCRKESRAARTDRAAIWVIMNFPTVCAGLTFTAINRFIKEHNQEPKPFIWKADCCDPR